MLSSNFYPLVALLAATASAQSTTTATVLIPNWCVTQTQPTVTVLGQDALTTYSYSCSINSAAVASASARASQDRASAANKASKVGNGPQATGTAGGNDRRSLNSFQKRDDSCYGWDSFEACIPWEITQGASTWAVHYTATGVATLDQECSFGAGGVSSGPATCTASGRLDPSVWGDGDNTRTHTFAKTDVDEFWIRNTVAVTAGGSPQTTGGSSVTTGTVSGSGAQAASASAGASGAQSSGVGVPVSIPTGVVAMAVGAGGILAAALAL